MLFLNRIFIALGFIFLFLLHSLSPRTVALALTTWNDARTVQHAFASDIVPLTPSARALVRDARAWRIELAPWIQAAPNFAWLPHYGGDFVKVPHLAAFADETLNAIEPALDLYDALHEKLARKNSFGAGLMTLAQENSAQIETARAALKRVKQQRANIDEHDLSPTAHWVLQNADRALAEWDASLRLLERAPALLGNDAPRYYLVLAQNNDEIRPTGGFISAIGVLRVERGEISVEWFGDSFAADDLSLIHAPPPAPLQKYMWASQWLLRDANWHPDFPTSARVAQSMYANDRHLKTDGVIAVDTRFLPRLVAAMDEVSLGDQPLAPENVIGLLKASWQPMPPGDMSAAWFSSNRKNFLAELMNGLLARFRVGDVRTNALAQALWRGLREKSVQMYVNDENAEQAILDAGWGGGVHPDASDYLFVVDSNVGFNKVNARVTREIYYNVDLERHQAAVEITYHNPSRAAEGDCDLLKQHKDNTYVSMEQSCYWNFARVFAPRGSQFISASGVNDAGIADDMEAVTAFGGYAIIPRNTTQTVKFQYTLPENIIRDHLYSLKLQQQAGAVASRVTVRVELPEDSYARGASHTFVRRTNNVLEFQEMLYQDTTIKIYLTE